MRRGGTCGTWAGAARSWSPRRPRRRTGAMAVEILAAHIPATDGAAALAQVLAEHAVLYAATEPVPQPHPGSPPGSELAVAAVRSLDPHQVKLVEACRRGHAATADPAFAAAAETVTGRHA